ncbi:MAG: hypothetical protein HW421_531 [Ignavibacteria bacterium]|nr:hypothetical protein [Ignavibacteria bacterium]
MNMNTGFSKFIDSMRDYFENSNGTTQISDFRRNAWNEFERNGIPTRKTEDWKYVNLSFIGDIDFNYAKFISKINDIRKYDKFRTILPSAHNLIFVNGVFLPELSSPAIPQIEYCSLNTDTMLVNFSNNVNLNNRIKSHKNPFSLLSEALTDNYFSIRIEDNVTIETPIHLINILDSSDESIISTTRCNISIGKNSEVSLIETNYKTGNNAGLGINLTNIIADNDSRCTYYKLQSDNNNSYFISETNFLQNRGSMLDSFSFSLDGKLIRNDLNIVLNGSGSESNLYGLYFADGKDLIDNHTSIYHANPDCSSNQTYKGILAGSGTGIFNGKIVVEEDAQRTKAYQSNKNILLSNDATINTKPQLEINADDVRCSHGATSGRLDEESLFYLRSRGISADDAKILLLKAFADDIISKVKYTELQDLISNLVSEKFTSNGNN